MTREEETKEAYKDYMNNGSMFQSNPWFYFKVYQCNKCGKLKKSYKLEISYDKSLFTYRKR